MNLRVWKYLDLKYMYSRTGIKRYVDFTTTYRIMIYVPAKSFWYTVQTYKWKTIMLNMKFKKLVYCYNKAFVNQVLYLHVS